MYWRHVGSTWILLPGKKLVGGYYLCPAIEGRCPAASLVKFDGEDIEFTRVFDHIGQDRWPFTDDLIWWREGDVYYALVGQDHIHPAVVYGRPAYVIMDDNEIKDIYIVPIDGEHVDEFGRGDVFGGAWIAAARMFPEER